MHKTRCTTSFCVYIFIKSFLPGVVRGAHRTSLREFCSRSSTKKPPLQVVFFGALGEIRTHDPCLRRAILYPAELQVHACFYTIFWYKNQVLLIHAFEKLCVVFGLTQLFHQEFHRICYAHWH